VAPIAVPSALTEVVEMGVRPPVVMTRGRVAGRMGRGTVHSRIRRVHRLQVARGVKKLSILLLRRARVLTTLEGVVLTGQLRRTLRQRPEIVETGAEHRVLKLRLRLRGRQLRQ
jgi:hypothetical protein